MSQKPFGLSVKALVYDDEGRVLILKRSADSKHFKEQWDFIGGKVDPGESLDETLLREAVEETSLTIVLERFAGAVEHEMDKVRVILLFFEARVESGEVSLGTEHQEYRWVPRNELVNEDLSYQIRLFVDKYDK